MARRAPEDDTWARATTPLRPELRVHCYRMLGSAQDADDMLQEALLRAWRARATLDDPRRLRAWLYRIATNVCLDQLASRPRRLLASARGPAADPAAPIAPPAEELTWLEPLPGTWLQGVDDGGPLARYTLKESVALAFVAALQALTPAQRATLLLRDVIGLSADETAAALGISLSSANSALFRARAELAKQRPDADAAAAGGADAAVLARYVEAFERSDVEALVAILRADVVTTMPPSPTWIDGRAAHRTFYGAMFARTPPGAVRLRRIDANGGTGLAFYRAAPDDPAPRPRAVEVLTVARAEVTRIDHFMSLGVVALFALPEFPS